MADPKKWHLNINLNEREMDIILLALTDFGGAGYSRKEVVETYERIIYTRAISPEWQGPKQITCEVCGDPMPYVDIMSYRRESNTDGAPVCCEECAENEVKP